ncbi:MAG: hypothetical protein H7Z15_23950 [Rhizobacter sp.]|nr:hypothetical protein [Rhizobacter sp.]
MNHSLPPDEPGPTTPNSLWVTTTPAQLLDDAAPASPHPKRKPQAAGLTPEAHTWLARLPPRYQPLATARRHPHIINLLSEAWKKPADLPAHFRELMLSSRPGRRAGFQFEVLTELADLQAMAELVQKGENP